MEGFICVGHHGRMVDIGFHLYINDKRQVLECLICKGKCDQMVDHPVSAYNENNICFLVGRNANASHTRQVSLPQAADTKRNVKPSTTILHHERGQLPSASYT